MARKKPKVRPRHERARLVARWSPGIKALYIPIHTGVKINSTWQDKHAMVLVDLSKGGKIVGVEVLLSTWDLADDPRAGRRKVVRSSTDPNWCHVKRVKPGSKEGA